MSHTFLTYFTILAVMILNSCGGGGGGAGSSTSINHPPVANAQILLTDINTSKPITLVGSDADGDALHFIIVSQPTHGNLTGTPPNILYTPNRNFSGPDSFTFKVNDGQADSNVVSVSVFVTHVTSLDSDNDFIPNDIELLLGFNLNNPDENNNGIKDGLESTGATGDQFFQYQWHLRSTGIFTNDSPVATIPNHDLGVIGIYHKYVGYNHGNSIIVQVVDAGVDANHPDLKPNMDLTRSLNGEIIGDPTSISHTPHGTEVAGIMAARAFNTIGVRGIAPFAKIAGSNWLDTQTFLGLTQAWLSAAGANEIAVSNNSWGSYYDSSTVYEDIMAQGTSSLRNGKGRIYVFAAGNSGGSIYGNGNANLEYMLSNRYAITVAALKNSNVRADYSTPGSNILVSGYSGNFYTDSPTIGTTYITGQSRNSGNIYTKNTWTADTSKSYTFGMNGTSAASPTVAGCIALVLEACPNLTWRDVKYLIAKHAIKIDTANPTWVTNAAGLHHSVDYGYGLINPTGMIADCTGGYTNLPAEQFTEVNTTINTLIPDNNTVQSFPIVVSKNLTIEWIEMTIDNNSTYASDYQVELTSPSGTTTTLMHAKTNIDPNPNNGIPVSNWMYGGFRLATAAMIDESSLGTWTLSIRDAAPIDVGTLKKVSLKIYGH